MYMYLQQLHVHVVFDMYMYMSANSILVVITLMLFSESGDHSQSMATLLSNSAACHLKNGDCKSCINDSTRSISLFPINLKALMRRGSAYETMEK